MKRTTLTVFLGVSVLLAGCAGASHRAQSYGGAITAQPTTSSSPTTTTTRGGSLSPVDSPGPVVSVDCPSATTPDQKDSAARRESLRMVSPVKGFAVAEGTVLVTDDGRTWSRRYSGAEPMFSVDAVDADHAWAVGQEVVLGTSDGGRSWLAVGEPENGMLRAVDFTDANTGWGITGRGLLRTADGGRTWQNVDAPCGGEAVCFTGPDDGWVASGANVYRTSDGGHSWEAAFRAPADDVTHPFRAGSIHVGQLECAAGIAWVTFTGSESGDRVAYAAYRGTAAGEWTPVMKEAISGPRMVRAPAGGTWPGPMSALGRDSALYVSFSPLAASGRGLDLLAATDGGRRLGTLRPIDGLLSVTALSFVSPEVGWVLGAASGPVPVDAILATTDAGRTWQEQYSYTVPAPIG